MISLWCHSLGLRCSVITRGGGVAQRSRRASDFGPRCTFRCGLEQVIFTLLSTGQTWPDYDEAGDYVVPNVLSPRDLVFRPDNMEETVPHT